MSPTKETSPENFDLGPESIRGADPEILRDAWADHLHQHIADSGPISFMDIMAWMEDQSPLGISERVNCWIQLVAQERIRVHNPEGDGDARGERTYVIAGDRAFDSI